MDNITESQVDTLQGFKASPELFEAYATDEYAKLIAFDIKTVIAPITLTQEETVFNFEMEEVGERIKLEVSDKVQKELGTTTLAFFDL